MSSEDRRAWRCGVCGYVHRGQGPPDFCPVCGADADQFEPYTEPVSAPVASDQWQCLNCGYVHDGPAPPDECPVCAATADRFEQAGPAPGGRAAGDGPRQVVVLGAGIAGVSAVEALKRTRGNAAVCFISREDHLPYYRLNLTRYLAGEITRDALPIHPADWYEENGIELVLGDEAVEILPDDKQVRLRGGQQRSYDRLILTIGAHPFVPPMEGAGLEGVGSLRTVADADAILAAIDEGPRCVVIGGGLLGLETAGALAARGLAVTLLESHEWLMPRQLNRRAGELLAEHVERAGISLLTEARTEALVGDERVAGVRLDDGREVEADLVVVATGVRPNSHLARRAGLEVGRGVVADNHLRSSQPEIFVAGDVAEHHGVVYGSWSASQFQGGIAGLNAAGATAEFGGLPRSNTLKVLGLDLVSIGQFTPEDGSFHVAEAEGDGIYRRFVMHDGKLVGAVLLGDASLAAAASKAIEDGLDFSGTELSHPTAETVAQRLGG